MNKVKKYNNIETNSLSKKYNIILSLLITQLVELVVTIRIIYMITRLFLLRFIKKFNINASEMIIKKFQQPKMHIFITFSGLYTYRLKFSMKFGVGNLLII